MRRVLLLLSVCALVSCAGLGSRRSSGAPSAVVTGVELVDVSFADLALSAHVRVTNPGRNSLDLQSCAWTLALADESAFAGRRRFDRPIPPYGTLEMEIPIAFHLGDLRMGPAQRAVSYILSVDVGGRSMPAIYEGTFPVPTPPAVALRRVHVRQLTRREATVQVDINIAPRGTEPLTLRALDCGLWLEGRHIADFEAHGVNVPVDADTPVPLVAHVVLGPRDKHTAAILQRREARYTLRGHAAVDTGTFGVLSLPIDETGLIALIPPGG